MQRQKVLVIGHFNRGNPGDEWMRVGMETSLTNIDFHFWGMEPPLWSGTKWFAALKACDRVWFGPGAILHDVPKRMRFRFSGVLKCLVWYSLSRIFGRPFAIVGAEVGPLKSRLLSWLLRPILFFSYAIVVRDQASFTRLKAWGLKPQLSADFSFACPLPEPQSQCDPFLGVACFPYHQILHADEIHNLLEFNHLIELLSQAHQNTQLPIRLIVMSHKADEDDLTWNKKLFEELDQRGCSVELAQVCPDAYGAEFLGCKLLLGMRFHACLMALRLKIPLLACAYHPKTAGLMAECGLQKDGFASVLDIGVEKMTQKLTEPAADLTPMQQRFATWLGQVNS